MVGGHAVGCYGYSRSTNDIDFFVAPDLENANRIILSLAEFGFSTDDLTPDVFTAKDTLVILGVEPLAVISLTT